MGLVKLYKFNVEEDENTKEILDVIDYMISKLEKKGKIKWENDNDTLSENQYGEFVERND